MTIESVVIPEDLLPEVTFSVTDDLGATIGLSQFIGSREIRFVLAYLEGSGVAKGTPTGQYKSYVPGVGEEGNATYDHNLADGLTENADGTILYKFETAVPADYDATATHQLGSQYRRTQPITDVRYVANNVYTFRPDGGVVTETREITTTATCNKCHTRLNIHGRRREVQYCILCHQPQTPDANFPEMIHKIHMGVDLPSVMGDPDAVPPIEGVPYEVSGHDYSTVVFPQPVTNCVVCHTEEVDDDGNPVAPHADVWKNKPTRMACGSCHDRTWFGNPTQTPEGYTNHPLDFEHPDDSVCATCHPPVGPGVAPIAEAHLPNSTLFAKLVLETTAADISVDGTGLITVNFTASDTDGNPVLNLDDTDQYRAGYLVGWPASEYQFNVGNSNMGDEVTNNGGGSYTYTASPGEELPLGTTDTFGFVFRGRSHLDLNGDAADPLGDGYETRLPMEMPTSAFFRTDGGVAVARREVVDDSACAACHGEPFAGHGSDRIGVGVCVVCHNTNLTSTPDDPLLPTVSVNMKDMIHRIHTGENLEIGYTTGGHGGDVDFTHIRFPGRREECSICHGDHDVNVPLPDEALSTLIDDGVTITEVMPERAACTSCHDGLLPNIHAILATDSVTGVETCAVCHGEDTAFAVEDVHDIGP